jgi:hypothetical protein
MINWLLQRFIKEIPEDISVCEFDCPLTKCTASVWAACELRHRGMLYGSGITTQAYTRKIYPEIPATEITASVFSTN